MSELKKQAGDGMSVKGFSPLSMNTPEAQAAREKYGIGDFKYNNRGGMSVPMGQGTTHATPQYKQKIDQAQEQFNVDYNKPAMAARTAGAFKQFGNTLNEMSGGQKPAAPKAQASQKDAPQEQKKQQNAPQEQKKQQYGIKNPYSSDAISGAKSFGEAFKQARKEIGAGGVFEYGGKKYNTFTRDEMKSGKTASDDKLGAGRTIGKDNIFRKDYEKRKDFTGSQDGPASKRAYYASKERPAQKEKPAQKKDVTFTPDFYDALDNASKPSLQPKKEVRAENLENLKQAKIDAGRRMATGRGSRKDYQRARKIYNRAMEKVNQRNCLLYTSPSPRDVEESRMPSSA